MIPQTDIISWRNIAPWVGLDQPFSVSNRWFKGETAVLTYSIEEVLATKLRALYQRKKGRDLFDFWYAMYNISDLNSQKIVDIFHHYMKNDKNYVSRADFEKNLFLKKDSPIFNNDIRPLLPIDLRKKYQIEDAYEILFRDFTPKLAGNAWKNDDF